MPVSKLGKPWLPVLMVAVIVGLCVPNYHADGATAPLFETDFCRVVENATAAYKDLSSQRDAAKEKQNQIAAAKIITRMTNVQQTRNVDVYNLAKRNMFRVDNWLTTIVRIASPQENCHTNMPSCVFVDVHPACSAIIVIHAIVPVSSARLQFLSLKGAGDPLTISGTFVERWGGSVDAPAPVMPPSSKEFEGSFTESGSMEQPEYTVDIAQLQ
jgi:hypothetical protein